ncbi:MAG: DUF1819 family protein [Lutispora sp.]|nr:DUF1819 family protein [Lutispora sp.]
MARKNEYSANLTGAWFLFYEIKQVVVLMNKGIDDKEIRKKVIEENLFQHKTKSSLLRALPSVLRRAKLLEEDLRNLIIEDTLSNAKLINIYAIMRDDLLFTEFMKGVVKEKYASNNLMIEKKDINSFFTHKAEQNEKVASFSTGTINKLRQVYLKILTEAGVIKDIKSGELNRIYFDPLLKQLLKKNNGEDFINIFQ